MSEDVHSRGVPSCIRRICVVVPQNIDRILRGHGETAGIRKCSARAVRYVAEITVHESQNVTRPAHPILATCGGTTSDSWKKRIGRDQTTKINLSVLIHRAVVLAQTQVGGSELVKDSILVDIFRRKSSTGWNRLQSSVRRASSASGIDDILQSGVAALGVCQAWRNGGRIRQHTPAIRKIQDVPVLGDIVNAGAVSPDRSR